LLLFEPVVTVPDWLSTEQMALVKTECREFEVQPKRMPPHSHPVAAAARNADALRLAKLARECAGTWCDLGGKPRAFVARSYGESEWVTRPVKSAADARRARTLLRNEACHCALPDQCHMCGHHDVYTLLDVIYHLQPADLVALLLRPGARLDNGSYHNQPLVYASVLNYSGVRGSFYRTHTGGPEVQWQRKAGDVHFYNGGVAAEYSHPAADWIQARSCVARFRGVDYGLHWDVVSLTDTRSIFAFTLLDAALVHTGPLRPDVFSTSYYGTLDVRLHPSAGASPLGPETVVYTAVPGLAGGLIDAAGVFVPRRMIADVAVWAVGRPREPATYAEALAYLRRQYKLYNCPADEFARALPHAVSVGLTVGLAGETAAAAGTRDFDNAAIAHRAAHADAFGQRTLFERVVGLCRDVRRAVVANPTAAICGAACGLLAAGGFAAVYLAVRPRAADLAFAIAAPSVASGQTICVDDYFSSRVFTALASPEARITIPAMAACAVTEGPFLGGIGIHCRPPTVYRACVHNEYAAVAGRACADRDLDGDVARARRGWFWLQCERTHTRWADYDRVPPTARRVWLARYPEAVRSKLVHSEPSIWSAMLNAHDLTQRKAFIKRENGLIRDGHEDWQPIHVKTPRLIQGCRAEHNYLVGPYAHALGNAAKNAYHHAPFRYASGWTPEQLDDWWADAMAAGHRYAFVNADAVRLDASVSKEALAFQARLMHRHGTPPAIASLVAYPRTHGTTRHGIRYSTPGTVASGVPTTTWGNTTLVVTVMNYICDLIARDDPNHGCRGVVAGDDICALIPVHHLQRFLRELESLQLLSGFEFEVTHSEDPIDAEFCAGVWWPTAEGARFGPKPGRLLPKLFYSIDAFTRRTTPLRYARGVALGLATAVAHLPYAHDLVQRVLELTNHVAARPIRPRLHQLALQRRRGVVGLGYYAAARRYGVTALEHATALGEIASATLQQTLRAPAWPIITHRDMPLASLARVDFARRELGATESVVAQFAAGYALGHCARNNHPLVTAYCMSTTSSLQTGLYWAAAATMRHSSLLGSALLALGMCVPRGHHLVPLVSQLLVANDCVFTGIAVGLSHIVANAFFEENGRTLSSSAAMIVAESCGQNQLLRLPANIMHAAFGCIAARYPGRLSVALRTVAHAVFNLAAAAAVFRFGDTLDHSPAACLTGAADRIRASKISATHAMSSREFKRATRFLDNLERNGLISSEGRSWATLAWDPFHDLDVRCSGYPDINIAPSVVQTVKATASFSCPPEITSGTWDLHLYNLPWFTSESFGTTTSYNGTVLSPATGTFALGGVNAIAAATGTNTSIFADGNGQVLGNVSISDSFMLGASRVIAAGFECVNTTPQLNIGGQVIAYRLPQPVPRTATLSIVSGTGSDTTLVGAGSYYPVRLPPESVALATLLPGARQWNAAQGCYSVISFNSIDIPADGDQWADPMITADTNSSSDASNIEVLVPNFLSGGAAIKTPYMTAVSPVNTSGVYFTGLSLESVITVTLNVVLERFPGLEEPDLVVLATPSPAYDVHALTYYSMGLTDMPPGVPVAENGLGDWFGDVISKVSRFVSPALSAVPHPYAKAAGAVLGTVGNVAESFLAPPNNRQMADDGAPQRRITRAPRAPVARVDARVDDRQDRQIRNLEARVAALSTKTARRDGRARNRKNAARRTNNRR
jgi:hypothetical protein